MITPARINDQELAVAAELAGVDDPAVARRHDLAAIAGFQHEPPRMAAVLGLLAEREHAFALRRQRQEALGFGEGYRRLDPTRRQHRHALAARRQHDGWVWRFGGGRGGGRGGRRARSLRVGRFGASARWSDRWSTRRRPGGDLLL